MTTRQTAYIISIILTISFSIHGFSQVKKDRKAVKYAKTIKAEELKEKLYIYASDEFEGRNTGEPGQKLAVEFIRDFYKENDIDKAINTNDYFQKFLVDFSGRPELVWKVGLGLEKIGEMDTELFEEFFKAFANESKCNLHIENLYGKNNHHIIESCFKAFAKSVRLAVEIDPRIKNAIPSSKGLL